MKPYTMNIRQRLINGKWIEASNQYTTYEKDGFASSRTVYVFIKPVGSEYRLHKKVVSMPYSNYDLEDSQTWDYESLDECLDYAEKLYVNLRY